MGFDLTGLGSVADLAKTVVNKFIGDKMGAGEKAQAELELQELFSRRDNAMIEAKKAVIVAELNQSDPFTKRARPMIVYCGLGFIFLMHVFFPILAFFTKETVPVLSLPEEFWWTWGGVCSVWIIGRSAERRGMQNRMVNMITGGSQ